MRMRPDGETAERGDAGLEPWSQEEVPGVQKVGMGRADAGQNERGFETRCRWCNRGGSKRPAGKPNLGAYR